ncbi:P-loop containing nucleoside triphosphate hydrolase protein [Piromyces finnis]|uniref:p-loop containing nucleoside triphosphate hydrolase protein n=1 Tax=Piromyces finnis TaxID=1754191 RepID=A0A1Y1V5S9_9FUNG|nr:P-loop containing nucleoside triphosphate hydrolase protein [Piromyces finnis]|eukprot:ORX47284.1 P-loop containing nucleoside triphosphate hydrolase protein [Piromyces finnis]
MASTATTDSSLTKNDNHKPCDLKVILLGDSAVGKSKLIERFLLNDYIPYQLSTYALTLYRHTCPHPLKSKAPPISVEFWDTAGQERFQSMHPSYYHMAHVCILCFDLTRKITYKNLQHWYDELMKYRNNIPVVVIANKVDAEPERAKKRYGFVERKKKGEAEDLPLFFVSASDGTNVVSAFNEAIKRGIKYKESEKNKDFVEEVLNFIEEEEKRPDGIFSKKEDTDIFMDNQTSLINV